MMVLQHVSKEKYMATMMVLQCVNNIGSKEKYMTTMMVTKYVNNIGSMWQQWWSYNMCIIPAVTSNIQQRWWQQLCYSSNEGSILELCTKTAS